MTNMEYNLQRFLTAQDFNYSTALEEIRNGEKRSHWIWFIFPQLAVLGQSGNAKYYGISRLDEAKAYLAHPVLAERLRVITNALLQHKGRDAADIFGGLDAMKVRSCMTLFDAASPNDIFRKVLDTFYDGNADKLTLQYIQKQHTD